MASLPGSDPSVRQALPLILCLMTMPGVARSQTQPHFTTHHLIQFETGTDQDRQQLSIVPASMVFTAKPFRIAREDLNDDGAREIIIMSTSGCASNGCLTWVIENRRGNPVIRMGMFPMLPRLAVANEKVGTYRALVPVDEHGAIVMDDRPGPRFGKQIVYATSSQPARPSIILNPEACAGDPSCTEVPPFVAMVTGFRLDLVRGARVITATVRFINKLDRTLVVGYVQGSGIVTDEQGNRYGARVVRKAMGEVVGEQADPGFRLGPGEIRDARFEFTLQSQTRALGTQYTIDLTVGELVPKPLEAMSLLFGRDDPDADVRGPHEWRLSKEYPLRFSGFTDAGITPSGPSTSTPTEAKLAGAYMARRGGPSMLERLTFTSGNEVTIEDGIARRATTYVIKGRKVTINMGDGYKWVFTIDGQGCLVGDVVSIQATLCRQ